MIKMKKKWLRGGVSLALVAVLSLSSVLPAFADSGTTAQSASAEAGNGTLINLPTSPATSYYEPAYSGGTATVNGSVVTVNNVSAFAVSVPKAIRIHGYSTTGTKVDFGEDNPLIKVSSCNLAPTQTLNVKVGENAAGSTTGGVVNLSDKLADGSNGAAKKKLKVYIGNTETNTDEDIAVAADNESLVFNVAGATNTTNTATIWKGEPGLPISLKLDDNIYAGVWYGRIQFTITTNAVDQNPVDINN